jgi:hypothetical protein
MYIMQEEFLRTPLVLVLVLLLLPTQPPVSQLVLPVLVMSVLSLAPILLPLLLRTAGILLKKEMRSMQMRGMASVLRASRGS